MTPIYLTMNLITVVFSILTLAPPPTSPAVTLGVVANLFVAIVCGIFNSLKLYMEMTDVRSAR